MYKTIVLKDHLNHPYYNWPVTLLTESVEFAAPVKPGCWQLLDGPVLQVDAHRKKTGVSGKNERVFSAQVLFE